MSKLEVAAAIAGIIGVAIAVVPKAEILVKKVQGRARDRREGRDRLFADVWKLLAYGTEFPNFLRQNWRRGRGPGGAGLPNYPFEVPDLRPHGDSLASREWPIRVFNNRFNQTAGFVGETPDQCIWEWQVTVWNPVLADAEAQFRKTWGRAWRARWIEAESRARLNVAFVMGQYVGGEFGIPTPTRPTS